MSPATPQWAIDRAYALANERGHINAFAAYIATHEEPPVDPLLIEARKIVASGEVNGLVRSAIHAGEWDTGTHVIRTLNGIRRGIELAKEQPS